MFSEEDVNLLLESMTLDEKISLCHGCDSMSIGNISRLGIGRITMADGPQGLRLEDGRTTTALPCGIALASSFDISLAEEYGALIARECLANDIRISLGPGFNLMRTPLNGRSFEYYGEDPVLAGEIAAGYVRGCQKLGVAACPKHIALNNQEKCRTVTDAIIDERPLRELYLRAFEIVCCKSHPWMMMSSLNLVNGIRAAHHYRLQQQIPKDEFGFDGVMVSDWGAAKETKAAGLGGLDLDMGHGDKPVLGGMALKELVENGEVPEEVINDKARRVLRLIFRTGGIFPEDYSQKECNSDRHRAFAIKVACDGMVLLKNSGILPLKREQIRRLAIIGPNADACHSMGSNLNCGGSGAVHPEYEITPLAGLREYLGDKVEISYSPGIVLHNNSIIPPELFPDGLLSEYFHPGETVPFKTQIDYSMDQQWGNRFMADHEPTELDTQHFRVCWTGKLVPKMSGPVTVSLNGSGAWGKLFLNGVEVIAPKTSVRWRRFMESYSFDATAEQAYDIRIEMERFTDRITEFKLLWSQNSEHELQYALELAATADIVLFFGGRNHSLDREAIGGDYVPDADIPDLELPEGQSELISRLATINSHIVVSLNNGSTVNVEPWIDAVPALLECWYPGMEGGRAIAGVLFGDAAPGGRLPFTWGARLNDYPCHANGNYPGDCGPEHPHVRYDEGIFVGYRHFDRAGIEPRFPFGFGLSYTAFTAELRNLTQNGTAVKVKVAVTNTGIYPGTEVIQLYVRDVICTEPRPEKELQAFEKVSLLPGEQKELTLSLNWRDFAFFCKRENRFIVESGEFELLLGTSSRNIFAQQKIVI